MREMFSPFDFEVALKNNFSGKNCFFGDNSFCEPISVLDSRIPSGITSSSTVSSSLGGGGAASADTAGVAAAGSDRNPSPTATSSSAGGVDSELLPVPSSLEFAGGGGSAEKCAMEDWECVLSETAVEPGHEQSVFRWILGDVEDPSSKFLQFGGTAAAEFFDFGGGFGVMDQAFSGENLGRSSDEKIDSSNPVKFHQNLQNLEKNSGFDFKPLILNQQLLLHQHHAQSYFLPFAEQELSAPPPPPAKRFNSGDLIPNSRQRGMFISGQQLNQQKQQQQHLQLLSQYPHHRPKTSGGDELRQSVIDHLYTAAELLQTGNPTLAHEILARLNHQLSPIGKPFQRAAFYCKEALQLLLHSTTTTTSDLSPLNLVFKIGAYKSFSEVSPIIDFANFTSNQALLEALEGFYRIHIVDFDIGYGGQWASFMQELALRNSGAGTPLLRITALATNNHLELSLARENLIQFAKVMNIGFELEFISIDSLKSLLLDRNKAVAVAVILPVHQLSSPLLLGIIKQLSPRIVVSMDRGCDRVELPFPSHIVHALHWYTGLLESLDAVNVNADELQKIERLMIQSGMEKMVMNRCGAPEKSQHWRSLFLSSGFAPVAFSSSSELQAECVVKRMSVPGFEVEKRPSSIGLCWQGKELLSVSVWR